MASHLPGPRRIEWMKCCRRRCHGVARAGTVQVERIDSQYEEDVVRRTVVRRFDTEVSRCGRCGARPTPLADFPRVGIGQGAGGAEKRWCRGGLEFSRGGIDKALARLAGKAAPLPRAADGAPEHRQLGG